MPKFSRTQKRLYRQAFSIRLWESTKGKEGINPINLNPLYKDEILKISRNTPLNELKKFANMKHKNIRSYVKEGAIKDIYQVLKPDARYDSKKKNQRTPSNLCDYREFTNNKRKMQDSKSVNEDCGCGGASSTDYTPKQSTYSADPNIGKNAKLIDGRNGIIDDSIRNSTGEVIGYVMNNEKGTFRVFKDKIKNISESGAMATLGSTSGMGPVVAPTTTTTGSGDQFPSLEIGTPASKKGTKSQKTESKNESVNNKIMSWNSFKKAMLINQTKK